MSYNSYEITRCIRHILTNNPHDIKSIMHFYNGWNMLNCQARISLEDILTSNTWTTDEKSWLLNFFQYIFEYEDVANSHFLLLHNIPPIDFALQFQNANGAIAYLLSGGHLSTDTFSLIKHHLEDTKQKSKIIEAIYSKYAKEKEFDIIDYQQQKLIKIPLNDYLGYILAEDIKTTQSILLKFKDDAPLLNKLLYYAVIEEDKTQIKLLLKTIQNNFLSAEETDTSDKSEVIIPKIIHPKFIKIAIQKNDIVALRQLAKNNVDLTTTLLFVDENKSKTSTINSNPIIESPLTPLQYALETTSAISKSDLENLQQRTAIIDYLFQISPTLETPSTYTQIIQFFVQTGNIKKAQSYFDDAINKNIDLDFSIETIKTKDNHYKCYIKHLPNYY